MPTAIVLEVIQALATMLPQLPEVTALVASVSTIVQTGSVTPEQEAAIRTQLDQVKALIDAA